MGERKHNLKGRPLIGEVLMSLGFVTQEQINEAVKQANSTKVRMGEFLVSSGVITENELFEGVAKQFDLEFNDLRGFKPSADALSYVPHSLATQQTILPLKVENDILQIALFDPLNLLLIAHLDKKLSIDYELVVSPESTLRHTIKNAYVSSTAQDKFKSKAPTHSKGTHESESPGEIETLVNSILEQAIGHQASDIHFEPQENEIQIRERIDGILEKSISLSIDLHPALISRLKILGNLNIAENRVPQDGRFVHKIGKRNVDFRISTLPTIKGEKVVLRILDKGNMKIGLSNLGLNETQVQQIRGLLSHPYGIILVCGPTGSGKTTTVYSMLNHLNSLEKNIVTIEDPVEYQFDVINQVQLSHKTGVHFSSILKNVLRQDPDIIMIGEIRDQETAEIAIRAALTGHLVISTLHTNDSSTAVSRLIDMGVEPFLISSSLLGVVAQRLVRKLCKHCTTVRTTPEDEDSPLALKILEDTHKLFISKGCEKCYNSGYMGREGVYEILVPNKEIRMAITEGTSAQEITDIVHSSGFTSMREEAVRKAKLGVTSPEEVLKSTVEIED